MMKGVERTGKEVERLRKRHGMDEGRRRMSEKGLEWNGIGKE
jgi:hypothetical protein